MVVRVIWIVPFLLAAFSDWTPWRAILTMKYDHFKGCAESLREIRRQLHNVLDLSVLAELDGVIGRLEAGPQEQTSNGVPRTEVFDDALSLIGRIIGVAAGAYDLISRFWN